MENQSSPFNPSDDEIRRFIEITSLMHFDNTPDSGAGSGLHGAPLKIMDFTARFRREPSVDGMETVVLVIGENSVLRVRSPKEWLALVEGDLRDAVREGYEVLSFSVLPTVERTYASSDGKSDFGYREVTAVACLKARAVASHSYSTSEAAE